MAPEDFPVCALCRSGWKLDEGKLRLHERKSFLILRMRDNERGYLFEEVTVLSLKVTSGG